MTDCLLAPMPIHRAAATAISAIFAMPDLTGGADRSSSSKNSSSKAVRSKRITARRP